MLAIVLGSLADADTCTYSRLVETQSSGACTVGPVAAPEAEHVPTSKLPVRSAAIVNGWLEDGTAFVGTYTSQVQKFIDASFAPVTASNYSALSLVNGSSLNRLLLSGAYLCDQPLRLPSMFVLNGSGLTLTPASNLSLANRSRHAAMVMLHDVTLSAVIGGTYDASSLPEPPAGSRGFMAISIVGAPGKNAVRHVRALANNTDAAIGINGSPHAEVAFSDVGGSTGKMH